MITVNYFHSHIIYKDVSIQLESKNGNIYLVKENESFYITSLPLTVFQKIAIRFRLLSRLFRLNISQCVYVSNSIYLLIFKSFILNLNIDTGNIFVEHKFRKGMSRCLYLQKIVGVLGFDDMIVYGEYFQNTNHENVSIYFRSILDLNWQKAFSFSPNMINHIHNIVADYCCVYVLTGDSDSESGIWRFENNFSVYQRIIGGSQLFRCCNLFRFNECFVYATDSPVSENYLCYIDDFSNLNIEKKYELNGPSIFSLKVDNNIFFSTSIEPDSRQNYITYLFARKRSHFIKENTSNLYWLNENGNLQKVFSLEKDCLPGGLFQFGNLHIISAMINNGIIYIVLYITGLRKYDGCSCIISITLNQNEF